MTTNKSVKKYALFGALFATTIGMANIGHAITFSSDISITGSVEFDTAFSTLTGSTIQGGTQGSIIGGVTTTTTITGTSVSGSNPLGGSLTDIGDGIFSTFNMLGINGDEGDLFNDFSLNLTNNSATDQYRVSFELDFLNFADADGTDAFVDSQFSLFNGGTEIFFTDFISDTFFGDHENSGLDRGTFGATLSDSGVRFFDFLLDPLASINLTAKNELKGGGFTFDALFNGSLESSLTVSGVENLTIPPEPPEPPAAVPVPAAAWLFGSVLLAGLGFRRRS